MTEKRIILPKNRIENIDGPLIFLAGPVQGAPRWQDRAIEMIHANNSEIYVAAPSLNVREEYFEARMRSAENDFLYQLDWERNYLELASKKGVILFWLPNQIEAMPINQKTGFSQPYARDTRPETAGWGWRLLEYKPKTNIVVGAEEYFDGINVITRNFLRVKPNMKFYSTLEQTCQKAIKLATQQKK